MPTRPRFPSIGSSSNRAGEFSTTARRYPSVPIAVASGPPGAALVRHLEERQPALYARLDEAGPDRIRGWSTENGAPSIPRRPLHRLARGGYRAFSAFMRHLRAADPQRTVLMVQVENEPGPGDPPGLLQAAQKLFDGPVPAGVLEAMGVPPSAAAPTGGRLSGRRPRFTSMMVRGHLHREGRRGRQGGLSAPALCECRAGTTAGRVAGRARQLHQDGGPLDNVIPDLESRSACARHDLTGRLRRRSGGYPRCSISTGATTTRCTSRRPGQSPRFFFFALGHQAMGFSPFGMDFSRTRTMPDTARPEDEVLTPWARTGTKGVRRSLRACLQADRPHGPGIARLNFEGKLQAVAEDQGKVTEALHFGAWDATVSYGIWARNGRPAGNPQPMGGAMVAQLGDNLPGDWILLPGRFPPRGGGQAPQFSCASKRGPMRRAL